MARTLYFKDDEESERYFENERKMKENSQKWHETNDTDEKARLHFQNQVISGENDLIDGGNRTFDDESGVWNVDYGTKAQSNTPWKSEQNNKYASPYNDEIDALYDEIVNQKAFSYNPDTDPSYKAYEDMYRREGDRASKSTLADISTAQGGVSSYAASAAQQASNAYAKALTDKIPELEALAYQKYSADRNDKYSQLDYLMALDNVEYGRYNDEWNKDFTIDERDYNRGRERELLDIDKDRYALERADKNYINDINVASQVKSDLIELISKGYEPTEGDLKWAGLTPEDVERIKYVNMFGYYPEFSPTVSFQKKKTVDKTDDDFEDEEEEDEIIISDEKNKTIEEIIKLAENGEISEEAAKNRIDRIKAGLNPTVR